MERIEMRGDKIKINIARCMRVITSRNWNIIDSLFQ